MTARCGGRGPCGRDYDLAQTRLVFAFKLLGFRGKRKHVRRIILAAKLLVKSLNSGVADEDDGCCAIDGGSRCERPFTEGAPGLAVPPRPLEVERLGAWRNEQELELDG